MSSSHFLGDGRFYQCGTWRVESGSQPALTTTIVPPLPHTKSAKDTAPNLASDGCGLATEVPVYTASAS